MYVYIYIYIYIYILERDYTTNIIYTYMYIYTYRILYSILYHAVSHIYIYIYICIRAYPHRGGRESTHDAPTELITWSKRLDYDNNTNKQQHVNKPNH